MTTARSSHPVPAMTAALHHRASTSRTAASSAKGRARVRKGAGVEAFVCALNDAMHISRIAMLRKMPTPFRVLGSIGPHLKCQRDKKAGVDFVGVMFGSGRAVFVECKSASTWRLPLSSIEPHQLGELRAARRAGAIAALLVVCGAELATCVVPIDQLEAIIASGVASINRAGLEAYRVTGHYLAGWT